jgi:hypothetical protein
MSGHLIVSCGGCREEIEFAQPYAYHAGFGNQGFLYDDEGTLTLVWDSYDPAYSELFDRYPWSLSVDQQERLESMLADAPSGGRWRFANPARCPSCGREIRGPMMRDISFLRFPGSPDLGELGIKSVMRDTG